MISMRKWHMLTPLLALPLLAAVYLLMAEPSFVSTAKLWAREKTEESTLLRISRKGVQETTYAEVQSEIIKSNRVFRKVVERMGLSKPPPSQSIAAKVLGLEPTALYPPDTPQATVEAVNELHKEVKVKVVNPEVLSIIVPMNSPTLAQQVLTNIIAVYREVYLSMLNAEVDRYEEYLQGRLKDLKDNVMAYNKKLIDFEMEYPLVVVQQLGVTPPVSPLLTKRIAEINPLPTIIAKIGQLEVQKASAAVQAGSDSYTYQKLDKELAETKSLLGDYRLALSEQAKLTVLHNRLQWELKEAQNRYEYAIGEYDKILVSRGNKLQQTSSISVLDEPSWDSKPIAPRRKLILLASAVLGLFLGMALCYGATVLDRTVYFPEELNALTAVPTLGIYGKSS